MKKKWFVLFVLLTVVFTGCTNDKVELYDENPMELTPIVSEYYESLGITNEVRKNTEAVYGIYRINEDKEVTLRMPEYWEDVYVIQAGQGITVYDKYSYDSSNGQMGNLWRIYTDTHEAFEWYFELEYYEDPYAEILGANSVVIGTDDDYVYILMLPTDVQADWNVENAWEYYSAAMDNKDKFIADFLAVNNITVNEKAPNLN